MGTTHQDLIYTVHIPYQDYLDELVTAGFMDPVTGNGFSRAPMEVAATVGTDLIARGHPDTESPIPILIPVVQFRTPSIDSRWIVTPGPGELAFPLNVLQFKRKSGGWFGISWLFGDTTIYTWIPHYEFSQDVTIPPPGQPSATPLPMRRWVDGAELSGPIGTSGEGGSGNAAPRFSRRASRHTQGMGYIFEDDVRTRSHNHTESGVSAANTGWERLYLRVMRFPDTIPTRIWFGQYSTGPGYVITLTSAGSLLLSTWTGSGAATPVGGLGSALTLNTWCKIDILVNNSKISIFVNGVTVLQAPYGIANLQVSTIGGGGLAGENCKAIFHIDDWIGANAWSPALAPPTDFTHGSRVAFVAANGFADSHDGASWGNRDWRIMRMRPPVGGATGAPQLFTSNVPSARLSLTTDAAVEVDAPSNHLGYAAMAVGIYVDKQGGGPDGQIGWRLPYSLTPVDDIATGGIEPAGSYQFTYRLYRPAGLLRPATGLGGTVLPPPDTSFKGLELIYLKGASTDPAKVQSLLAAVEIIGQFGPEDLPMSNVLGVPEPAPPDGTLTLSKHVGIHNAPYPHSPWATQLLPPESLTSCKSGQYTGNGTAQDLHFRNPVQFLWIRNSSGFVLWVSSFIAGHIRGQQGHSPESILEVLIDPSFHQGMGTETNMDFPPAPDNLEEALAESNALAYGFEKNTAAYEPWTHYLEDPDYYWKRMLGWQTTGGPDVPVAGLYAEPPSPWLSTQQQQTLVRLAGSIQDTNVLGTVYTYFGFCDPGVRFCNAGALIAGNWQSALDSPLDDPNFTPQTALLLGESPSSLTTPIMYFKGLGSAANAVSNINGAAEIANALTFAQGKLTQLLGIANPNNVQLSYIVFRQDDGSNQTPPAGPQVIWLKTYVGNGTNPRTITFGPFTPSTNRRPMWCLVVGHNGTWIMRDPAHTTNQSTNVPNTSQTTTGITGGGIEQIIVNSSLNQSGVTYDVLCFPGSDCDNGTGWSCIGEPPPPPPPTPPCCGPPPCTVPPPCIWSPPPPPPPPPPPGGGVVCDANLFPFDSDTA